MKIIGYSTHIIFKFNHHYNKIPNRNHGEKNEDTKNH